jgi:hypothetical protein
VLQPLARLPDPLVVHILTQHQGLSLSAPARHRDVVLHPAEADRAAALTQKHDHLAGALTLALHSAPDAAETTQPTLRAELARGVLDEGVADGAVQKEAAD